MVIAIIAILASMLLPALGRARDTVTLIDCLNRQRQLHLAYSTYAEDNNGMFPYPTNGGRSPAAGWGGSPPQRLEDYGLTRLPALATPDAMDAYANNLFLCPGELRMPVASRWTVGYELVVGWPGGQFGSTWLQLGRVNPAATVGREPWLFSTRCAVRVTTDIGKSTIDQCFFACGAENFDVNNTAWLPPKYGSHSLQAWGSFRGNTLWSDGHGQSYSSTDASFKCRVTNGSFHEYW